MSDPDMLLHWSPRSPYVRLAMIAAHERGLADRIERVRTVVGSSKANPDILADNPVGKIPTLVLADATRLYDSRVITTYFDTIGTAASRLVPDKDPARIIVLRRQALGVNFIDLMIFWMAERRRPKELQLAEMQDACEIKFLSALRGMDGEIATLGGVSFDAGQLAMGCALCYADFRFGEYDWRKRHPDLAIWHAAIAARPSFVATEFVDDA